MKEEKLPLISIIIPVYNGGNYMKEAVDSALSQTYKNVEIIVINDGSNDNGETERIALSYGDKIRYFYKENGGVSSALNLGIKKMNGEYFSWLSHDDIYYEKKLSNQINHADKNTLVMCGRNLINEESQVIDDVKNRFRLSDECELSNSEALIQLFEQGCFNGCTLLIPKEAFIKCGMFNEQLRYCQDLLKWIEIFLDEFSLKYVSYIGVGSRVHSKQLTNTGEDLFHSDCKVLSDVVIDRITKISTIEDNILFSYAKYNAIYNNRQIVKDAVNKGKDNNLFSIGKKFNLLCLSFYGMVRPCFRKLYHWARQKR